MFNALFTKTEEYAKLAQALGVPGACALFGIPGAGRALVYAALSQALDRPLCIVTPGEAEATHFADDLKALGLAASDCDGILVTHEHSDHVKGLSTFLKKNPMPVYGAAATLDFLDANDIVPANCELNTLEGREEDIGCFGVQSFPTSHDVPCVGYRIHTPDDKTMTIATDLGTLTPPVHEALSGCDLVALESNYDLHMLRSGPYPYYLRARIESVRGHLSNDECSAKLLELIQSGCKKFALCHLSQENNTPALALQTVFTTLGAAGVVPEKDCIVQAQRRNEVSPALEF